MSKSTKATTGKILIFDSLLFTYSFCLLFFGAVTVLRWFGVLNLELNQEYFVEQMNTLVLGVAALMAVCIVKSLVAYKYGWSTVGGLLFASPQQKRIYGEIPFFASAWGWHICISLLLTVFVSVRVTEASMTELLDQDGLQGAYRLWSGLTSPNWELLPKAIIQAIETIYIAFLATLIAIPIAFLLAFLAAKNLMRQSWALSLYLILRLGLNISRSVEPLIWALIFTVWVGVGPFAGMLALMIHSVASLTKYYSEIIESVDDGPIEGIRSTGANHVQVVWYAIVPQIVLPYIAMTVYRWDTNVRMATVIGLVGGGGIGTLLIQYQGQAMWPEVGCIIAVIAVIVWLMDTASAFIREALK